MNKDLLFDVSKIKGVSLKNKVGMAPMTRISATKEGLVTDRMVRYYRSFAKGGFGLILTEGTYIDMEHSQTYHYQPGIASEEQANEWKHVVDAVHAEGGKIVIQLQHTGPLSQGNRFTQGTVAPSSVQPKGEQLNFYLGEGSFKRPREMGYEEMMRVKQNFVEAAKRAKAIGFDGVELHGANGYLLDSFLTEYTNVRVDEYGGNTENRVRYLVEIAEAVKRAVSSDDFIVGMRISQSKVNDYMYKWSGKEEDAKIIFGQLGVSGLDYLHITEFEAWQPAFEGSTASLVSLAKEYSQLPIIANGQLDQVNRAIDMIESGDADIVALGKGALANHDWIKKVQHDIELALFDQEAILHPIADIKDFEIE